MPEQLRAGYRLLKNAGYLPPEAELLGEIHAVETLLRKAMAREMDPALAAEHRKRLALLRLRLGESRSQAIAGWMAGRAA